MTEPLLSVEDLIAGYGGSEVLKGISFSVEEGKTVSLLGRNGAGKTTTLRCIIGSLTPIAGSITFKGEEQIGLDITERVERGMTLVPEDRRVFPELTVEENLRLGEYGGESTRPGLATIDEIFEMFGNLERRRTAHGATLSGGEQQMLAIAQAMLTGADLILLDEPTEGLAPTIVEELIEALEELQRTGCTVVLVEQNLEVALRLADRNYIVDQGEIVFQGTSNDVAENGEIIDRYLAIEAGKRSP